MKHLLLVVGICLAAPFSFASECTSPEKRAWVEIVQELGIDRRGCCSWHDGVCGCDYETERVQCCDGTLSPSCRC